MKHEQLREREKLAAALAYAAAIGKVTPARLMSPEELAVVVRDRPDLQGKLDGWCLCTEVPQGMWQRALEAQAEGRMPNHITVAETQGSGKKFLAIVIQAGEWQHRLCVPLVGAVTTRWLNTLVSGLPLQLTVATAASERAFVSFSDVPAGAIAQMRDADTSVPADWRGLLDEAMRFMAWNATVAQVDRRPGQPLPTEVSLSLLFPAEVQAELELIEEATVGRRRN